MTETVLLTLLLRAITDYPTSSTNTRRCLSVAMSKSKSNGRFAPCLLYMQSRHVFWLRADRKVSSHNFSSV